MGQVSAEVQGLVDTTRQCLQAALDLVRPGTRTGDLGHAIQSLAESRGYGVVREYTGHGIGKRLHEEPTIYHHGARYTGLKLQPGMVFTIEPMINLGTPETRLMPDRWTVTTADKKPVKNVELWQRLDELNAAHQVDWRWVKGHAGDPGNERADQLANRGVDSMLA